MSSIINQQILLGEDYILVWIESFLKERTAQNLAKGTVKDYKDKLARFVTFLDSQEIKFISQIRTENIRDFLLLLTEKGHNAGGVHGYFRTIKAFLRWCWDELEPNTRNPIDKVKAPKVPVEPIEGVSKEDFESLLSACSKNTYYGERDRTILLVLYDTGVRASELCSINLEDINFVDSSILIRQGKGRKPRFVFFGKSTRKQLRRWINIRGTKEIGLFVNRHGERVVYGTLREVVRRLSIKVGIKEPGLHDFRRAFTLNSLNSSVPEITIARLLGHTTTALIGRYAKQKKEDLQLGYKSPVDN